MRDVMIDLETLGTVPGCVILSIGAVYFDELSVSEEKQLYSVVSQASCEEAGLHISEQTKKWWEDKDEAARKVLDEARNPHMAFSLRTALSDLNDFVENRGRRVWGNGGDFDNALLAAAFHSVGMEPVWDFWNNRCYRTVKNQFKDVKLARTGTYHNALDDARSQAGHLVEICRTRGWRLS